MQRLISWFIYIYIYIYIFRNFLWTKQYNFYNLIDLESDFISCILGLLFDCNIMFNNHSFMFLFNLLAKRKGNFFYCPWIRYMLVSVESCICLKSTVSDFIICLNLWFCVLCAFHVIAGAFALVFQLNEWSRRVQISLSASVKWFKLDSVSSSIYHNP